MAKINIKLSKQQKQLLIGGGIGLIAGGFCYIHFFWLPISDKIAAADKDISDIEAKIDRLKGVAGRLTQLQAQLEVLKQQSSELEKQLPKQKSTPDILVKINELAVDHNVILLSFTPGGAPPKGGSPFYNELPYPLSVKGSFHNIGKFLAAVSLEERIFNVKDVNYPEASGETGEMVVTFVLISYQYKGT
jgi:Tfp pilus assembly protein PilO